MLTNHDPSIANTLRQGVAAMGSQFNDEILKRTVSLYEPHVAHQGPTPHAQLEVAYGAHERQVLDFYPSSDASPIVLYVHGGGFVGGGKKINDCFYSNLGHYFSSLGIAAALMNYRLAPEFRWPEASQDIALAVEWLRSHGARHRPIYILGQSAGAAHLATYLMSELLSEHATEHVSGAILMSGFYDARGSMSPGAQAYYGSDAAEVEAKSSLLGAARLRVPVLLTLAQYDPPGIALQTLKLASQLTQVHQTCPPLRWMEGHNHVSTVLSIGTPQHEVGDLLIQFIRST